MFYYSKKSRRKVVHYGECACIQNVDVDDIGSFETLEEAYANKYRLCRHCSPIAKRYRKEIKSLMDYCQSHAASVFFCDKHVGIKTPISRWKIIPVDEGGKISLYHKNTFSTDRTGPVPGYHYQWVERDTIAEYLEYITEHDFYRNRHPLSPAVSKSEAVPARKGSKRYRKEQKRAAKKAKRQAIANVYRLFDSLQMQANAACV